MMGDHPESDDREMDVDEDAYTDTDLFDAETVAKAFEGRRQKNERKSAESARARVEEMVERKRLDENLRDYDDDFDITWV